jgi:hypothetical protein
LEGKNGAFWDGQYVSVVINEFREDHSAILLIRSLEFPEIQ